MFVLSNFSQTGQMHGLGYTGKKDQQVKVFLGSVYESFLPACWYQQYFCWNKCPSRLKSIEASQGGKNRMPSSIWPKPTGKREGQGVQQWATQ